MEGYRDVLWEHDVGSCKAAGLGYVEVSGVGVYCEYHVAGAVVDAIVGIGGEVIKELEHIYVCVVGGGELLLCDLAEGYQKFVVYISGIIADVSDKLLDAEFPGAVKRWAGRSFHGVLNLFPIDGRGLMVRGLLRFIGVGTMSSAPAASRWTTS